MSIPSYQPVPTSPIHPPTPSRGPSSHPSTSRNPLRILRGYSSHFRLPETGTACSLPLYKAITGLCRPNPLIAVLGSSLALLVVHFVLIGAFPNSSYAGHFRQTQWKASGAFETAEATAEHVLDNLNSAAGHPGTFFRDSYPLRSMLAFHKLAKMEVKARGLDTCRDQLGERFIDAYASSELAYCLPTDEESSPFIPIVNPNSSHHHSTQITNVPPTQIWCTPVRHNSFTKWWPYPAAPCLATHLRPIHDEQKKFTAVDCHLTNEGKELQAEMGTEAFLGSHIETANLDSSASQCKEVVERTVLVIGRQDQWNPFHVAEDLVTTVVTALIAAKTAPELVSTRVQLVFSEGYGMDANHFTTLWDRIGAWAPRRLSLDPWGEDVCLTNSIHSIGAGASLFSAMGVGHSYTCASSITWAASHYYRHLFGLLPRSLSQMSQKRSSRTPINVLWLSRAKLDAFSQKKKGWSSWSRIRHIDNEPELVDRLRSGLSELCQGNNRIAGQQCIFEDAQDVPETWALSSPETLHESDKLPIRFATLDPMVHALETQIHFVGHSTILVSSHGGALGLSLLLPPGDAALLELQVSGVLGNYHFQHMAHEMGHIYEQMQIERTVDVDSVWSRVESLVEKFANPG